jgi:hypothetical protein
LLYSLYYSVDGNLELQGLVDHLVGFLGFVATAMVVNRIKLAYRDAGRI